MIRNAAEPVSVAPPPSQLRRDQVLDAASFTPPGDDVERFVAGCWREVTGFDRIGADDDFFALGGTSMQAAAIFGRLADRFGFTLPLSALYRAPTVRGLAAELLSSQTVPGGRVVPIQAAGSRPPLFVAPGIGGGVVGLAYLARALGDDWPVYGFESRGLNEGEEPRDDMHEIAAEFVRDLKRAQPEGPYRLLGICWGAVAALEIARQLRAVGDEVATLLMLDPPPPGKAEAMGGHASRGASVGSFIASRLRLYWDTLRFLPPGRRLAFLREKLQVAADILRQRDLFRGDASELRRRQVLAANRLAARRYVPVRVDCPVRLIFTTGRPDGSSRAARRDWLELLSPVAPPATVPGTDTGDAISPELAHYVADVIRPRLE